MTETNQKIIDMILKNASVNEISKVTGLSNKQLFYRLNMLKIKGYNFSRKYYYDGEITYKLQKGFEKQKEFCLLTRPKDTEFKAVFISDLHLSNKYDRVDLLNQIYDFCVKDGINIIINGGDIIDGFLGYDSLKKFKTIDDQIDYLLKVYPYDKNILNFTCLGNHDYDVLEKVGQNLETILLTKRHDIVPLGYGVGRLKIKNDEIIVRHPKTPMIEPLGPISEGLMLTGHTHKSQNIVHGNLVNIYLSSLSDLKSNNNSEDCSLPGFVKATINFQKGIFNIGTFEQYIFADKIYKVNESQYELYRGKNINQDVVKYEEDRIPYSEELENVEKVLTKDYKGLSQIERFNKRYGRE